MNLREQIRQRANRLRNVPLESVLRLRGARPDRHDKQKWHTSRGILSVNGTKFINWNRGTGGGGAIDLVIHLEGDCSFREALDWLHSHFPQHLPLEEKQPCPLRPALSLPPLDPAHLRHVRSYLVTQRALTPAIIDPLIGSGTLYADAKANAVFLLQGIGGIKGNGDVAAPVGAELRGTGSLHWRGMAPGSRKDHGYFSIPADLATAEDNRRPVVLCESAIDAISCFALHSGHWCISTSGARPNPAWLASLIDQSPSRPVYCGFDADDTGDTMARAMNAFHPQVQRLRPARHDWNDMLTSRA
jgi:hypothetical protein